MTNAETMTIVHGGIGRGAGMVNSWVDLQLELARGHSDRLAGEAAAERLARHAVEGRRRGPGLRTRVEGAIAGWRQPNKVLAR